MSRFFQITALFLIALVVSSQALPVFDTELVASPLMHEVRISYRGGRKAATTYEQQVDSKVQRV